MSSRAHIELIIQFPHKWLPKFANKSWIHVRYNDFGNTMKFVNIIYKEINGSFFYIYFFVTRDEISYFGQVKNKNQNSSEIVFGTFR